MLINKFRIRLVLPLLTLQVRKQISKQSVSNSFLTKLSFKYDHNLIDSYFVLIQKVSVHVLIQQKLIAKRSEKIASIHF